MTVVQQILFTAQPERWWALAEALGFTAPFPPSAAWGEFHADGSLALHPVSDEYPAGRVDLHLLVDDLDAAERALAAYAPRRSTMAGVGELVTLATASGIALTVAQGAAEPASDNVSAQPIWFAEDLAEPRAILEALGLRADIASDRGGWVEMRAAAGSVGLHAGEARIGLSFEARGDLEALAARLQDAGFDAAVVDEAFARTVRVADPDGGDEIWINGVQEALHGYHRES